MLLTSPSPIWKIFFCLVVGLITAVFVYFNIKDILPIPIAISVVVFIIIYAGATHLVKY